MYAGEQVDTQCRGLYPELNTFDIAQFSIKFYYKQLPYLDTVSNVLHTCNGNLNTVRSTVLDGSRYLLVDMYLPRHQLLCPQGTSGMIIC